MRLYWTSGKGLGSVSLSYQDLNVMIVQIPSSFLPWVDFRVNLSILPTLFGIATAYASLAHPTTRCQLEIDIQLSFDNELMIIITLLMECFPPLDPPYEVATTFLVNDPIRRHRIYMRIRRHPEANNKKEAWHHCPTSHVPCGQSCTFSVDQ